MSLASRISWFEDHRRDRHPVLVASRDGEVVGWAAYSRFRGKAGYDSTMEHTLYVRHDQRGAGLGRALLTAILARAEANGVHVLLGALCSENEASLVLHQSAGFVEVGRMPQIGRKFDRWLDLVWVQRTIIRPAALG